MRSYKVSSSLFILTLLISYSLTYTFVNAQSIDDLKSKINERNDNIKQLEQEIKGYQGQINALGKDADTLSNTLSELDLSKKKLQANLAVTENKIAATNLEIKELSLQIDDKSEHIDDSRRIISQSLTNISKIDQDSVLETLLGSRSLAEVWNSADELNTLQANVSGHIHDLQSIKLSLEDNKRKTEEKKSQLVSLQIDLSNQQKALAETVKEKNALLASTKNTEANYKKLVAEKQAQKAAFEKELFQYESALKVAIDKSQYVAPHTGILANPLADMFITQYFGKTVDAQRLYVSGTHGGIDLRATIGTPVMAAMGGIVTDTEAVKTRSGCQYGKFVLIKHPNGLSTLYGHLSLVNVSPGSSVSTGQVIGYSGSTGYATGPHLHFGVYATQGVRVVDASDLGSTNCSGIKTVASPLNGYLDPMAYL